MTSVYTLAEGRAIEKETVFCLRGKEEFIKGFENLLVANGIDYSKPQFQRIVIREPSERPQQERRIENLVRMITADEVVRFAFTVTPTVLSLIYAWYNNRKNRGQKICIEKTDGTIINLDAKGIKNFRFTERKPKKKRSTKKRGKTHRTRNGRRL